MFLHSRKKINNNSSFKNISLPGKLPLRKVLKIIQYCIHKLEQPPGISSCKHACCWDPVVGTVTFQKEGFSDQRESQESQTQCQLQRQANNKGFWSKVG